MYDLLLTRPDEQPHANGPNLAAHVRTNGIEIHYSLAPVDGGGGGQSRGPGFVGPVEPCARGGLGDGDGVVVHQ